MRLKCRYEGDIRIVTVTAETDFAELVRSMSFFDLFVDIILLKCIDSVSGYPVIMDLMYL